MLAFFGNLTWHPFAPILRSSAETEDCLVSKNDVDKFFISQKPLLSDSSRESLVLNRVRRIKLRFYFNRFLNVQQYCTKM